MPDFLVTSGTQKFKVTAPDQDTAMKAFASLHAGGATPQSNAPGNGGVSSADDPFFQGLALPGQKQSAGAPPVNVVPPNAPTFGFSSSDTLNPLPALSTYGNELAANIPIAGPTLRNMGENFDAALDNLVYRPLTGQPGVTTPQDVAKTNAANVAANPEIATAGRISGPVAAYLAVSRIPGAAKLLGLEGPTMERLLYGLPSTYAINTADNVAHGESVTDALIHSILPTAAAGPFIALGGGGNKVASELQRSGLDDPAAVAAQLERLGPSAVVGDISPRMQALTAAVARVPGPGQDAVTQALLARAEGANSRIKGTLDTTFGGEPVPSQVASEIDAARHVANAGYKAPLAEKALSGATPAEAGYDAAPLAKSIDDAIPQTVGDTRTQIQKVRSMLNDPATGKLTTDPSVILSVRHELDGTIQAMKDQGGSRTTIAALGDLRKTIDDDLAQQVPGIKRADAAMAEVHAQQSAFDLGRDALGNGANAIHPVDLAAAKADLSGPRGTFIGPRDTINIAPQRLSEGTLSRIYQTVGTTANDRVALRTLLKGDGSWNREKLVTIFGEAKTQKLIDLLDAEATMQRTENMAVNNSVTATAQAARDAIEPGAGQPGILRTALNFRAGDAAAAVADKLTGGATRAMRDRYNAKIAAALLSRSAPVMRAQNAGARAVPMVGAQMLAAQANPVIAALLASGGQ